MVVFPKGEAGAGTANALFSRYLKSTVVNGAAANTNIAIAGLDPRVDELVSVVGLSGGSLKTAVVAGAAANNDITVTGITTSDKVVSVIKFVTDATAANIVISDLTSEVSITATNTIRLSTTTTASDLVFVIWQDYSFGDADFTSAASIYSQGNMRVSVSTVGARLHVLYTKRGVR